ncbi:MAG: DUF11 domain-containing protein, partial [Chloroflexi bacterium]|nr:DUF11 domain-containing protein [Chloroflexota bacterium]
MLTTEYQGNGFNPAHDGVFIDQSEVILVAPSLFIDKSVIPDLADIGETVTYTIVVANNGLNSLEDVAIVDTLPVGVTPITAETGISETVDIAVGEAVTYTIPVTGDAGQVDDVVNTVYVDHVAFDEEDSATLRICKEIFVVTNAFGTGSISDALNNICEGGTITFENDFSIDGGTYNFDRAVTIDGAGFDVVFDQGGSLNFELFMIPDGVGPVIFKDVRIYRPMIDVGDGGQNMLVFDVGTSSELILDGVTLEMGNKNDPLIINDGQLTIINSQVWGDGGTGGDAFVNNSVMTVQNSAVDASINN